MIGRKGAYRGVHFSEKPFFVIDTAFYLEAKERISYRWAFYEISQYDIDSMDSGSAIPSTSRDSFYSLRLPLPPVLIQSTFEKVLALHWSLQESHEEESQTLAALRDLLLPKLLSGEIRVAEAEQELEVAGA